MTDTLLPEPEQPIEPGNGGGEPPPPPPPPPPQLSITQVSPIAAALVGGVEITISGTGFQPGAQVFFGSSQASNVSFVSDTSLRAVLPPAGQTGSVNVTVVNPNGTTAARSGGFTYITMDDSGRAEVLGVDPLAVIENIQTDVTLRGRNLIAAHNAGLLVLRGPARANLTISNFRTSTDAATGIDEITVSVRVAASPPLAPQERLVVQILASRRAEALSDGIFESSRQLFTVLPSGIPVLLGYTANLDPTRPNVVVVTGKNLQGCSLNLGTNATIHLQRSDDDIVAGIVTIPPNQPAPDLSVLSTVNTEIARLDMEIMPIAQQSAQAATEGESSALADTGPGAIDVTLTAVPGQQVVAPSEQDSTVFKLTGASPSNLGFNWSNLEVSVFDVFFRFRIINIVRLIPFFDGGDDQTPITPQVGRLFSVRGTGILFALRVEITITITVVIVIGFRNDIWGFGLFNEFPEFPWAIGSFVIGFRVHISIDISIHSLTALVLPGGRLQVLAVFDLQIGIDFTISNNGLHLHFDPRFTHKVIFREIKPFHPLFLCDGRFQLAEENGLTVFPDSFGGHQSFYFARAAGECCFTWRFDMELVRFTDGGPETTVQQPFNADLCLNAAPPPSLGNIIITSEHPAPTGFPPRLVMTFDDLATLRCLAQPVDAAGNPTGPPQDVTTLGYDVEFFIDLFSPQVLDPTLIGPGSAAPILAGDSLIRAKVWPRQGEIQLFTFWPGGILGFAIINQLNRGLAPAVIGSNPLPVTVQQPTQIAVTPTLVFTGPQNPTVPTESPSLFTLQQEAVREIERYEPFEAQQLEYRLAVKLSFPSNFSFPATLRFKIASVQMMVVKNRGTNMTVTTPPVSEAPLANTGFSSRQSDNTASHFFEKLVQVNQEVTINLSSRPAGNTPIELTAFKIAPNIKDEIGQSKLVPPGKLVADKEVILLINLQETSGAPVAGIKQLKLGVRNDETYEEYLRVFPEVRTILMGGPFENFASTFFAALPATGAPSAGLLETKGKELWNLAVTNMPTLKDDRPLYWSRLQAIGALRAHYKRKGLGQPTVFQFEWPSRGLEQVDGRISFGTPAPAGRKAIVTGFDPFQLTLLINRSNPSGLIALALRDKTINSTQGSTLVKTAIFPVRYKDFDDGIVENAVEPNIGSIDLLMTCSQGRDFYDVERFAGKNRGHVIPDNNNLFNPGTAIPNSDLTIPSRGGTSLGGAQFLESTLPYERVITSDSSTRTGPPFSPNSPFIVNQHYWILGVPETANPGKFRPAPTDASDDATFLKKEGPDDNTTAREGSGRNFLSNEIFYRTALLRTVRPALPSGHLHVPPVDNQPQTRGPGLLTAAETALMRFLNDRLQLRSLRNVVFPQTGINRTSAPLFMQAMNESNATVSIESVQIDPQQGFTLQTTLPTQVNAGSVLSLAFTFTPTEVRVYRSIVRARGAGGVILFSAQLTGEGIPLPPAPQITGFDPTAGQLGDTVTIFGTNLDGATAVRIGTVATTFFVVSPTEISADVTGPPRIGQIFVDTPSGTAASSGTFRVIRPPRPPIE